MTFLVLFKQFCTGFKLNGNSSCFGLNINYDNFCPPKLFDSSPTLHFIIFFQFPNQTELYFKDLYQFLLLFQFYCVSQQTKTDKRQITPDNNVSKKQRATYGQSPRTVFSPASFSPSSATPSTKYSTRTNSGEIVATFNSSETITWKTEEKYLAEIVQYSEPAGRLYMSYNLTDFVDNADENIEKLTDLICEKFKLEDLMPVKYKHPASFITSGRLTCDADGRLNAKSILLEGSRELSSGESVQLDLSSVPKYSVFPGQVVVVEGFNVTGEKLVVKKIHYEVPSSLSVPAQLTRGPLNIIIASGPFTQSDTMRYQPLLDLLEVVSTNEPHLLILTGPFIDVNHPHIVDGTIAETYETLFEKLVEQIMSALTGIKTQVVLVSSYKDVQCQMSFPTPPFVAADSCSKYSNLHLLPDPCIFEVEDIKIGVTSTDILMHLGREEISCPHSADRLSRLANHIISQRNFYPLFPPAEEVPLDPTQISSTKMNNTPHIVILPSDLRYFVKDVAGCVVVNPERLAKGVIGGTYCRLQISSGSTPAETNNISAEILKI